MSRRAMAPRAIPRILIMERDSEKRKNPMSAARIPEAMEKILAERAS